MSVRTAILLLAALAAAPGGCGERSEAPPARVAATNTFLECAARDLLGADEPVLRLAGPGMCPGHYDVRPGQVRELRRCRVLLRLDFQASLDRKLSAAVEEGLRIVEVSPGGGLCEPESYLRACRRTSRALTDVGLLDDRTAGRRLDEIAARMDRLTERCLGEARSLAGEPVVASVHQAAFCRRLGLEVVATFRGADTATVGEIEEAIRGGARAGARLIVANLPEGRAVADKLAERLGARVVVFGNFPAMEGEQTSFDALLEANVAALLEAAGT